MALKPKPVQAKINVPVSPPRQPQHQRPAGPGAGPNAETDKRKPTART